MNSRLKLRDLSVRIAEKTLVDRVNIDVGPGQVCGIAGESGSGKSLTALSIMGLLPSGAQRTGIGHYESAPLFTLTESEMCAIRGRNISMIFQEPMTALNPVRTIGDQVAETLLTHGQATPGEAREIAAEKLDRVGLPGTRFGLERYPHELSGGQRQRVMIAQAIALRPGLLIADEPTTALDVTTQASILDLLAGLVDEYGMSMLLITHDLAVLAGISHTINIMQNGVVVESGVTETLFRNHQHVYTKKLFAASNHIPARPNVNFGSSPLLNVQNLLLGYPENKSSFYKSPIIIPAVKDVSFSLVKGESLGIVGESGCGKSTLARAILGLEPIRKGQIEFNDAIIKAGQSVSADIRAAMQIVFQDPYGSFNPRHKVGRLIAEPLELLPNRPIGTARDRLLDQALEEVGLQPADKYKFIHEFSGGQRQRIAIARSLVIRPSMIILDEAVSVLDVSIRAQIIDLLVQLREQHSLTYIFISHDLSVVRAITDRVLVMRSGHIVEEGATNSVLAEPKHSYTQELIAASPRIPQNWLATAASNG